MYKALIIPLEGGDGGSIDNTLPGGGVGGGHPSHGLPGSPGHPSHGLPGGGGHPSHGLPGSPGRPDQGLPPLPPEIDNDLPPEAWPGVPVYPATPEHPINLPPGSVYPPLPPSVSGKALALVFVLGVGYRWVVIENVPQPK